MKAQQFFFLTLGILAALLLGGGGGYYYATTLIHTQTLSLQQKLAQETADEDQINQLIEMKHTYQKLLPIVPKIDAALPHQKQESEAALDLQQLAANAGMSLPSVNFLNANSLPNSTSQTIASGSALALPISFELSGTYPQLQAFLQGIENLDRYTAVNSLTITHKDDKAQTLSFNLQIDMYFKP